MTDGRFGAMQFHVEPAVGILEAGAAADIALAFCPDSQHRYTATASCAVHQRNASQQIVLHPHWLTCYHMSETLSIRVTIYTDSFRTS